MSSLAINVEYNLRLNADELRIVCAALRGTMKEEWKKKALEIQERIILDRERDFKSILLSVQKVADCIREHPASSDVEE